MGGEDSTAPWRSRPTQQEQWCLVPAVICARLGTTEEELRGPWEAGFGEEEAWPNQERRRDPFERSEVVRKMEEEVS